MDVDTSPILVQERRDAVLSLHLNRPGAYNSLSHGLLQALLDALQGAEADPEIRVIVVSGEGKAFCAGHDLKEIGADRREEALKELFSLCSTMMVQISRQPQPVIAKVDGIATAAGCQLVAACDLAIATERSRFATSGVKYGLFCSTPMVALSRNVPRKAAMEMLLTGDFIDAAEAWRLGLINQHVPENQLDEAIDALVARLIDKPADVLAMGKRAFYSQLEMGLDEAYQFTTGVIIDNALGPAFEEGLDAFVNKRQPQWNK
ncbi:MAG: enoyl-CoA hydratase [Geminicoccaceae bacterium]